MTEGTQSQAPLPPRSRWGRALATQPKSDICALADKLTQRYKTQHRQIPVAGLAMMQVRESVLHQHFNLGEVPLATAEVALEPGDGKTVTGGAAIMVDDQELAVAIATCDAVLAHQLDGAAEVSKFLNAGAAVLAQRSSERETMRQRSRVDFALLNQRLDDDDHA